MTFSIHIWNTPKFQRRSPATFFLDLINKNISVNEHTHRKKAYLCRVNLLEFYIPPTYKFSTIRRRDIIVMKLCIQCLILSILLIGLSSKLIITCITSVKQTFCMLCEQHRDRINSNGLREKHQIASILIS